MFSYAVTKLPRIEHKDEITFFNTITDAERNNYDKPIKILNSKSENDYFVFLLIRILTRADSSISMLLTNLPSQNFRGNLRFDDPGVLQNFTTLMKKNIKIKIIFRERGFINTNLGKLLLGYDQFEYQYTKLRSVQVCPCEFILVDKRSYLLGKLGEFIVNFGSPEKAQHLSEKFAQFWRESALISQDAERHDNSR
jgi:hypothetical protein